MRRALSFDNSPPLSVPLRFFINAPVFTVLAGLLLLWAGPQALESRWSPYALALTHLLTLGVLASAMAGALMQILPVATGISILAPRLASSVVHALLTLGTLALAAAFLLIQPWLFHLALCLLALAFLCLLAACAGGLWRHRRLAEQGSEEILLAVRLAICALFATVVLGVVLAAGFAWSLSLPMALLTDVHAAWGLLGWVGLLVMGMAYQVIPIFQATELYPRFITRWLAPLSFTLLVLWTGAVMGYLGASHPATRLATVLLFSAYTVFAIATFYLLWTRKRPKADATTLFWRTAMVSLASCTPIWLLQHITDADYSVLLGVLFIVGFAWSAINGMLYKILPFLLWHNSQRNLMVALRIVPKVKTIIPDPVAVRQFWAHLPALLLLAAASLWPTPFTHAAALVFTLSVGWLGWNVASGLRLYLRAQKAITQTLAEENRAP
ncbi:hypothetical protein H0A66_05780 [Alcaligenaceae bacterium]|nr:hypothetical protein [Alcaligenaceae bacterium]